MRLTIGAASSNSALLWPDGKSFMLIGDILTQKEVPKTHGEKPLRKLPFWPAFAMTVRCDGCNAAHLSALPGHTQEMNGFISMHTNL